LVFQRVQLEVDVAELPLDVGDVLGELDVHVGGTREEDGANSVV